MMNPASIDQWFPVEQQRKYVSQLKGRVGVTRRRAEYFVKLWAYLLLVFFTYTPKFLRRTTKKRFFLERLYKPQY
jgi:hypothetical protein